MSAVQIEEKWQLPIDLYTALSLSLSLSLSLLLSRPHGHRANDEVFVLVSVIRQSVKFFLLTSTWRHDKNLFSTLAS
jgi:hypothetical protein